MRSSSKKIFVNNYIFEVWKEVYEPAEDSLLFAENMKATPGSNVLDIGTGCGVLGVLAAKSADEVLSSDINPYAVRCAKENAVRNNTDGKMFFLQGDLFNPMGFDSKFDLVTFNAPYLPLESIDQFSWLEKAWDGGPRGRKIIDRFLEEVHGHLKKGGHVMLMQSNLCGITETLRVLKKHNLKPSVVAERNLPFFETISLIQGSRQ
jgi:release factor glutamine methyltransferase